ncbi:unnamed protein product, partial [Prorocentrum cordatum]
MAARVLSGLETGRRVCVLWNDGEDWQVRVLLTPATAGDLDEVMGISAIDDPEIQSRIWYALSPDGDTYPHLLAAPPLAGLCLADSTDRFDPTLGEGRRWSRRSRTYGEDWAPTPLELSRAIRFAVMGDSDGSAPAHRMVGKKPMTASGVKALTVATGSSATRGRPAGTEVEVGAGVLESPAPMVWQVVCMSDGALGPQTLEDYRVDSWATIGDFGVAKVGGRIFLFRAVDKKTASEGGADLDARVMPVLENHSGEQKRVFRDAVKLLQESHWSHRPDMHPRARHVKWKAECRLQSGDAGVADHELAMGMFEVAVVYDQLFASELACFEYLARRAQMAEWRRRHLVAGGGSEVDVVEGECLCMGAAETRGLLMVAPELQRHITEELHKEAAILKERRKLRDERATARGPGGGALGSGGAPAALESKIKNQADEIERLQARLGDWTGDAELDGGSGGGRGRRQAECARDWECEVHEALNGLYSHGAPKGDQLLSSAQGAGVQHVKDVISSVGPPCIAPAAAFAELCGHAPGCAQTPEIRAPFQRDLVSLPRGGHALCDGLSLLEGVARDELVGWKGRLMRPVSDMQGGRVKPCNDPKFVRSQSSLVSFLLDLYDSNLLYFGLGQSATVGVFFVLKSDKVRQRLIFDTRAVNQEFAGPGYTQLPTAGAWNGLTLKPDDKLFLSQVDIDNAFYRILLPPRLSRRFVLPAVSRRALLAARPGLVLPEGGKISGFLRVLPMGWTWGLYFCQSMVETAVRWSGFPDSRLVRDRHTTPDVRSGEVAAVCVDGVAILGADSSMVDQRCRDVTRCLQDHGLICKGVERSGGLQKFTGLHFDVETGEISLGRERLWRLRLGLVCAADQRRIAGGDLRRLVGHFTWAALVRRELPAIFDSVYRFADRADRRQWRMWPSVELELRRAAALVCFCFVDPKRPPASDICAADASGSSGVDAGGRGVVSRGSEAEVGSSAWRARPGAGGKGGSDFLAVTAADIGAFDDWGLKVKGRRVSAQRHRLVVLCDNLSVVLALGKGRSSSPHLVRTCREMLALSLLGNLVVAVRWIPSELNQSDRPSRLKSAIANDARLDPRSAWCDAEAAARWAAERQGQAVDELVRDEVGDVHGLGGLGGCFLADPAPGGPRGSASTTAGGAGAALSWEAARVSDRQARTCASLHQAFLEWARRRGSATRTTSELDIALAQYLDMLYFGGFSQSRGQKTVAALRYYRPECELNGPRSLVRARAALSGFRRRAPGGARRPLPRPAYLAILGAALHLRLEEFALALVIAWGWFLRLPTDIVEMVGGSLVAPSPSAVVLARGLLLFPSEAARPSK